MAALVSTMNYLNYGAMHNEKPFELMMNDPPPDLKDTRESNLEFETRENVSFHDARPEKEDFSLDVHGFAFAHAPSKVTDFADREQIIDTYLPETEQLLLNKLKVPKVVIFDWRIRKHRDAAAMAKKNADFENRLEALPPAPYCHIDQSEDGALRRCRAHMGEEAEELLKGRFRVVNVWRPLRQVKDWPLAFCDSRTVKDNDLMASDLIRKNFKGESYIGTWNPEHKWYYLSDQQHQEVTMLSIYDTGIEDSKPRCLHGTFKIQEVLEAEARESIEVRALVFG